MIFRILLEATLEAGPGWVGDEAEERQCWLPGWLDWAQWQVGVMFDLLLQPCTMGQDGQLARVGKGASALLSSNSSVLP